MSAYAIIAGGSSDIYGFTIVLHIRDRFSGLNGETAARKPPASSVLASTGQIKAG
jgi:hypothetical protein